MKNRLGLLSLPLFIGFPILTNEVTATSLTESLISFADKEIEKGTISVDKFITVMQNIHEVQKSTVKDYLEKGNILSAQETLTQRSEMYPVTIHLYDIKA